MNATPSANRDQTTVNREQAVMIGNGWLMLPVTIGFQLAAIGLLIYSIAAGVRDENHPIWGWFILALLMLPTSIILYLGFFTLQPLDC